MATILFVQIWSRTISSQPRSSPKASWQQDSSIVLLAVYAPNQPSQVFPAER